MEANNMSDYKKYLKEQLKNKEFKKEWGALQPEMALISAMVDARTSKNITQKDLALKTGINQADISKIENGIRKPSIKLLQKIANAMDMMIKVEFVPKKRAMMA